MMGEKRTHVSSVSQPDAPGVSLVQPREYVLVAPGESACDTCAPEQAIAEPWASLPHFVCGAPVPEYECATRPSSRGIVMNPDGTLLLATTDELHEFVFSGGEIEHGETDLEALVREVEEETGWLVDQATARPVLSIDDYHTRDAMRLSMRQVNRYFVCQARPGGAMHLDKYEAVAGLLSPQMRPSWPRSVTSGWSATHLCSSSSATTARSLASSCGAACRAVPRGLVVARR